MTTTQLQLGVVNCCMIHYQCVCLRCEKPKMAGAPHLALLVLREQRAVEVLQRQLGHGHPLPGVVAHGKGRCRPSRHGHTILRDDTRPTEENHVPFFTLCCGKNKFPHGESEVMMIFSEMN